MPDKANQAVSQGSASREVEIKMFRIDQKYLKTAVSAVVTAVVLGAQAPGAFAQVSSESGSDIVLAQGTVIPVNLNTELTSNGSQQGDKFTATVDSTNSAYRQILNGATVDGIVRNVTPQDGKNPGTLAVAFTQLHLASGSTYTISGSPTSLDPKFVTTRADGVLQARNTNKDEHLTYAGYGAGAGLLVSVLTNGNIKVKDSLLDSAIGGVLGYVAGSVLKGPTQVHDVDLKPGAKMGVLLDSAVRYSNNPRLGSYRQQSGSQQSYTSNGNKYYSYNGQPWVMNLATGQRRQLSNGSTSFPRNDYKRYTYQGNQYVMNRSTGARIRLR
jgi:hypothetical protein